MKIETKYNIGQEVYYKRFGEIYELEIKGVKFTKKPPIYLTEYYVVEKGDNVTMCIAEELLFPTKEELLKSL